MEATYTKETNAEEIYRNGIENYCIVQIPKTKYCAVSKINPKTLKFTTWILDLMAKKKWVLGEEIEKEKLKHLLAEIWIHSWHNN